ncbi:MAG: hypothetical protein QG657_3520 [Acidobacteriota bacterium]|nr:hypothetical protein [Acidobacteriota bacterium]
MKKQNKKRLTISKITISNLNTEELDRINGGTLTTTITTSGYYCDSRPWDSECVCKIPPSNECVPTR